MSIALTPLMMALGTGGVVLLAAVVFLEAGLLLGFFLPGDSLLFAGGLLVASGVIHLPVWAVIAVVAAAAVLGDQLGFTLGRRLGPRVFQTRWLSARHLHRAEEFFARHGSKAVVIARFVPVVRTLTPFLAGTGAMPRRRFTAYNAGGGIVWVTGNILAGFFLGGFPLVAHHVELIVTVVVLGSLVPVGVSALLRHRRARAERAGADHLAPRDAAPSGPPRTPVAAGRN